MKVIYLIKCTVKDINKDTKAFFDGDIINIEYNDYYKEGDVMHISCDTDFVSVSFDESQKRSIVYTPDHEFTYELPIGKALCAYDSASWSRSTHRIVIEPADDEVAYSTRNIALNSIDFKENKKTFFVG